MSTALDITSTSLSFNRYMLEIKKYPRLTEQEEVDLFTKYHNESCNKSALAIVTANLRFVVHIARQYRNYNLPIMELIQEGNIGLMKAVKMFSLTHKVRFVTYAVQWIRSSILSYVAANSGALKFVTSKPRRKLFFNKNIVYNDDGQVNDVFEISAKLNVPVADIRAFIDYNQPPVCLSDNDENPIDLVDTRNNIDYFIELEHTEHVYQQVTDTLNKLNARDQDIIRSRILTDEKTTLQELADRYKVSCERIRQLETKALAKLKQSVLAA